MSTEEAPNNAPKPPKLSAVEIQQEYFEAVGDVDWELYEKEDRKYLLQKIAVALCGPPSKEGNLGNEPADSGRDKKDNKKGPINQEKHEDVMVEDELKLQGYELRDEECIMKVFSKICEQAKYSYDGEKIHIKILRVVAVIPKEEVPIYKITPADYWVNLHNKSGDYVHTFIFHVFCLRQCIPMTSGAKACKVYIDHDARVYKNWNDYLTENTLMKCVLVVPADGEYTGKFLKSMGLEKPDMDVMPSVLLSVVPSPALGLKATVLNVSDTLSTVANIGALVGVAGAFVVPVIAPVALGTALGVGLVTGAYGIVRASVSLADRGIHEQEIGLGDSAARGYWINILVSTVGISCSAAGKLLAELAATGTNVKILMTAVQFLQYGNIGTGVLGAANSLADMIMKYHKYDEVPSKLEVFQLTTSLLFLGIGAMSNQTAQEIVQDAQANKINEIRESLSSNNKKKMFDKVTAETRRVKGTINGNSEVITALKKIDNKDEFFGKLRGMNKQLNKNKLRISLSADGNPVINNQHNMQVADLQALGRRGREQLFSKYGPAKIDSKNAPTRVFASSNNTGGLCATQHNNTSLTIRPEEIIKITNLIINLSTFDQNFIAEFLSDMSAACHDAFLLICAEVTASLVPKYIDLLLGLDRNYKVQIVLFVFDYLKSMIVVNEDESDISFLNVLKKYVKYGRISKETILQIKHRLLNRISQKKKLFDDPHMFEIMHDYNKRCHTPYLDLRPGETFQIGSHSVLIKHSTIEKLGEWIEIFLLSQLQCEILLKICFELISSLSKIEIHLLQDINPDEDVINVVCFFLIYKTGGIFDFLIEDFLDNHLIRDIALNLKDELLRWRNSLELRKYETCKICQGRRYIK